MALKPRCHNNIKGIHMSEETSPAAPRSFWIIAGLSLVWNLIGIAAFFADVTMSEQALTALPEAQRAFYDNVPAWATAAYAVAVCGGVIGCLLLLLRKSWATPVLIVSLVGVVVQMYHAYVIENAVEAMGSGIVFMSATITFISILLVWYSRFAASRGWIS